MVKLFFKTIATLALGLACGIVAVFAYRAVASNSLFITRPSIAVAVAAPVQLIIPSIQVNAPIKPVGIDAKGNIGVPADALHVAWYKNGPRPGAPGVAVIDGHLDTKDTPQAVFYNLDHLKRGNKIEVRTTEDKTVVFTVTAVKTIAYNAPTKEIFYPSSTAPQLVLITCTGDWVPEKKIYNERLVVFAEEAGN